jgi:hypothetical protein
MYPVPMRGVGEVHYNLASRGAVRLGLVDELGREVKVLVNETQDAGSHGIDVDVMEMVPGGYFLRLERGGRVVVRPIVVE